MVDAPGKQLCHASFTVKITAEMLTTINSYNFLFQSQHTMTEKTNRLDFFLYCTKKKAIFPYLPA